MYACTHAWWSAHGPEEDPLGTDAAALKASRDWLRELAAVIIPGHGAPFRSRRERVTLEWPAAF